MAGEDFLGSLAKGLGTFGRTYAAGMMQSAEDKKRRAAEKQKADDAWSAQLTKFRALGEDYQHIVDYMEDLGDLYKKQGLLPEKLSTADLKLLAEKEAGEQDDNQRFIEALAEQSGIEEEQLAGVPKQWLGKLGIAPGTLETPGGRKFAGETLQKALPTGFDPALGGIAGGLPDLSFEQLVERPMREVEQKRMMQEYAAVAEIEAFRQKTSLAAGRRHGVWQLEGEKKKTISPPKEPSVDQQLYDYLGPDAYIQFRNKTGDFAPAKSKSVAQQLYDHLGPERYTQLQARVGEFGRSLEDELRLYEGKAQIRAKYKEPTAAEVRAVRKDRLRVYRERLLADADKIFTAAFTEDKRRAMKIPTIRRIEDLEDALVATQLQPKRSQWGFDFLAKDQPEVEVVRKQLGVIRQDYRDAEGFLSRVEKTLSKDVSNLTDKEYELLKRTEGTLW